MLTHVRGAARSVVAGLLALTIVGALVGTAPTRAQGGAGALINEFVFNHTGTDTSEYLEVVGAPTTDYSGLRLLVLEGDASGTATGLIDRVYTPGTTDAGGRWVTPLLADQLENGTQSLLLVAGFSGALGADLDADDDGALDTTPWSELLDSVAVSDGGASDRTYEAPVLGAGFDGVGGTPGGASRLPDGADTDGPGDWARNDFDLAGLPGFPGTPVAGEALNTPGAANQGASASPTLIAQPQSQTIAAGQSTTLSVVAAGAAPLSYQWYQGATGTTTTPVGSDGPGFTTPALSATTSYWVRVSNSLASVDSQTATLTIGAVCLAVDTPVGQIQGAGAASPAVGVTATVQGVVVGDYEGSASASLQGFYLQDGGDGDAATSDGIFIFTAGGNSASLGQIVEVTGPVSEFSFGASGGTQTQLSATAVEVCGSGGTVAPAELSLPLASAMALEAYEGMLVRFPQTLFVTEHFQLGRFGQVVLSAGGRLRQPTSVAEPGAAALALQAANDRNRLYVDDGGYAQNPDPISFARGGQPLSASNTLRGGDSVAGLTGVLGQTDAAAISTSADPVRYRLHAPGSLGGGVPSFVAANPRPGAAPAVGGTLRVAASNVLNYFLTLDATSGSGPCGPSASLECRGANTAAERTRQRDKLLVALAGLDADVLGLVELENTAGVDPVGDIASGLNGLSAPGTYAAIATGLIGSDAIKVGLVYRPGAVTPVGAYQILDSSDDARFLDTRNRPVLAQSFRENVTGEIFTVAVAHLKSKGSDCDAVGDPDLGDGQGNCNLTRKAAAQALVDWLGATFADPDYLIIGDLNSYAREDPVTAILAGPDDTAGTADDYTNLILRSGGAGAYSYAFDGQWGYLDHALASAGLAGQAAGAAEWHINADEPSVLDYNTEFKSAGQLSGLYAADAFRIADHDPVIVGLRLGWRSLYLPLATR